MASGKIGARESFAAYRGRLKSVEAAFAVNRSFGVKGFGTCKYTGSNRAERRTKALA